MSPPAGARTARGMGSSWVRKPYPCHEGAVPQHTERGGNKSRLVTLVLRWRDLEESGPGAITGRLGKESRA
jgi:hypothetical protein